MPSKRESSARVDYVPALCTHRPSLLPIGCAGEASGLTVGGGLPPPAVGNLVKPSHLEEGEVVTRFASGIAETILPPSFMYRSLSRLLGGISPNRCSPRL